MNMEQFFKEYSWEALESERNFTGDITAGEASVLGHPRKHMDEKIG